MLSAIFNRTVTLAALLFTVATPAMSAPSTTFLRTNYHGWAESYLLGNGTVEAVVVPAIGRVMQFRFVDEPGVFWENPALAGRMVSTNLDDWAKTEWVNFGGDKAWPSPEGSWAEWTKRLTWRPPPGFDGLPYQASVDGSSLVLTSAVDPFLGIQVTRRIELPERSALRVTTTFTKRSGAGLKTGIWVVTQLKDPVRLFAPLPAKSVFTRGYHLLSQRPPPSIKVERGYVSLTRDPASSYKIGLDASTLLWIGEQHCLRIDSPRLANHTYPDRSSNTEIYTNPDALPYVELECLGPVREMATGGRQDETITYRLSRRTQPTPELEAQALMKPGP
jgi:hypothetical protein